MKPRASALRFLRNLFRRRPPVLITVKPKKADREFRDTTARLARELGRHNPLERA